MTDSIHSYIKNLSFQDYRDQLSRFESNAFLRSGLTYSIHGYSGSLTFKEIVYGLYEKSRQYVGELHGRDLHNKLITLRERGEKAVENKPWYVILVCLAQRFFAALSVRYYLNTISEWNHFNTPINYLQTELPKIANRHRLPNHSIFVGASFKNSKPSYISVHFPIPARLGSGRYQLPNLPIDSTKTCKEYLETIEEIIDSTLASWIEFQRHKKSIQLALQTKATTLLQGLNLPGFSVSDCTISYFPSLDKEKKGYLTFHALVYFYKGNPQIHDVWELELPPITLQIPLSDDANNVLLRELESALSDNLEPFLKKASNCTTTQGAQKIFEEFFGNFSLENNAAADTLEVIISQIETVLDKPGNFSTLLNQKKYSELKSALKRVSFTLHPDKLQQSGASQETIDKAKATFQVFEPLWKKAIGKIEKLT